jgi:hypothetical protein
MLSKTSNTYSKVAAKPVEIIARGREEYLGLCIIRK